MKGRRIRALVLVLIVAVALLLVAVAIALFVRNIVGDNAVEPGRYVTIPADYDPAADEWPGASLGFVGPEGLGKMGSGVENQVGRKFVADDKIGGFAEGFLEVSFPRSCSEYDAHCIVEDAGGVWVSDNYIFDNDAETRSASVYFPAAKSKGDLEAIAEALTASELVDSACLNAAGTLSSGPDARIGE